jgi:hypothetical protein
MNRPYTFQILRAAGRGEWRLPGHGRPPDVPTIETIVLVTFCEITNNLKKPLEKRQGNSDRVQGFQK